MGQEAGGEEAEGTWPGKIGRRLICVKPLVQPYENFGFLGALKLSDWQPSRQLLAFNRGVKQTRILKAW